MKTKLKPYMVFNRRVGSEEGATLVFHHTAQQAKVMGWQSGDLLNVDEYLDVGVRLIRSPEDVYPFADFDLLAKNEPHSVWKLEPCEACEFWGCGVDENGRCNGCGEPVGDRLLERFKQWNLAIV